MECQDLSRRTLGCGFFHGQPHQVPLVTYERCSHQVVNQYYDEERALLLDDDQQQTSSAKETSGGASRSARLGFGA